MQYTFTPVWIVKPVFSLVTGHAGLLYYSYTQLYSVACSSHPSENRFSVVPFLACHLFFSYPPSLFRFFLFLSFHFFLSIFIFFFSSNMASRRLYENNGFYPLTGDSRCDCGSSRTRLKCVSAVLTHLTSTLSSSSLRHFDITHSCLRYFFIL